MVSNTFCCQEIDEIRQYINQTLCEQDQLMTGHFPLTEQLLLREGKPCGIFFFARSSVFATDSCLGRTGRTYPVLWFAR